MIVLCLDVGEHRGKLIQELLILLPLRYLFLGIGLDKLFWLDRLCLASHKCCFWLVESVRSRGALMHPLAVGHRAV